MDLQRVRAHCLAKPGVDEGYPFGPGALVFKVGGKMFALIGEDDEPLTVSLKCEPGLAAALREAHPSVRSGYHLNKRHWNTVSLDGTVPDDEVRGWIDDSYDLVCAGLPRRVRDALAGPAT